MRFKTVKKTSDIKLEGITIDADFVDGTLKRLGLIDKNGNRLQLSDRGYSSLAAEVPAPPEMATKYRLSGKVAGVQMQPATFEYESEALEEKLRIQGEGTETDLAVEPIEVPVDEA